MALRNYGIGFFSDEDTQVGIRDLSECDPITIFAGAGVSLDQGMPGWARLVRNLLRERLPLAGIPKKHVGSASQFILRENYETSAATMVDALYRAQYGHDNASAKRLEDIRREMYPTPTIGLAKPSLVERTLLLAHALKAEGRDVHIVTTNYDDLFEFGSQERALVSQLLREWNLSVETFCSGAPPNHLSDQTIPISHIHGFVPRGEGGEAPVFSEPDYFTWESESRFKDYLVRRFAGGALLMLGSSLRDNNVLRLLRNTYGPHLKRYAVVATQGEAANTPPKLRALHYALAGLAEQRGQELGVTVLRPDFYSQVYQFLDEVRSRVVQPGGYVPYVGRVDAWTNHWYGERHGDMQLRLSAMEAGRLVAQQLISQVGGVERAKVEMWVRRPNSERAMELWASSQGTWTPGDGHWPKTVPISNDSAHAVVHCFAMGTPTHGRVAPFDAHRWTHYLACPIVVADGIGSIPVGVVVALFHVPVHVRDKIVPAIVQQKDDIAEILTRFAGNQMDAQPS